MTQGFSGISKITNDENFISNVSDKNGIDTSEKTTEFISQNPEFWNNVNDYIKKCCDIFLHCLEPLENEDPTSNFTQKDPFVFFDSVIVSLQGAYAEKHNIPYGDNAPPVEKKVDLKWREDTLFLLILLKEIVSTVLPENTPLTIKMWFGGDLYSFIPHIGDMMITTSALSGVSKIQRLKDYKVSFVSEISYISLQKLPSGEYIPYSKEKFFPAQIEEYNMFFRERKSIEKMVNQVAHVFADVTNCEPRKIISIFKVYCFRRWKATKIQDADIISDLHYIIHKEFPNIITDFIRSFEELDKLAKDIRRISERSNNTSSGCLWMFLLLPVLGVIALVKSILN